MWKNLHVNFIFIIEYFPIKGFYSHSKLNNHFVQIQVKLASWTNVTKLSFLDSLRRPKANIHFQFKWIITDWSHHIHSINIHPYSYDLACIREIGHCLYNVFLLNIIYIIHIPHMLWKLLFFCCKSRLVPMDKRSTLFLLLKRCVVKTQRLPYFFISFGIFSIVIYLASFLMFEHFALDSFPRMPIEFHYKDWWPHPLLCLSSNGVFPCLCKQIFLFDII